MSFIADFYQVSVYRDQYHFSLKPVLLSELEPDSILQPPPQLHVTRGRKVVKRLKRTTRETQARRNGRLLSPETRILRQEQAQERYLSEASYYQIPSQTDQDSMLLRDLLQESITSTEIQGVEATFSGAGQSAGQQPTVSPEYFTQDTDQEEEQTDVESHAELGNKDQQQDLENISAQDDPQSQREHVIHNTGSSPITYNFQGTILGFN